MSLGFLIERSCVVMATDGKLYAGTWLTEAVHVKLNQKKKAEGLKSQGDAVRVAICKWLGVAVEEASPPKPPKAAKTPKPPKEKKESAPKAKPTSDKKPTETLSDLEDLDDEDDDDDDEPVMKVKEVIKPAAKQAAKATPRIDSSPAKVAEKRKEANPPVKKEFRPMPSDGRI